MDENDGRYTSKAGRVSQNVARVGQEYMTSQGFRTLSMDKEEEMPVRVSPQDKEPVRVVSQSCSIDQFEEEEMQAVSSEYRQSGTPERHVHVDYGIYSPNERCDSPRSAFNNRSLFRPLYESRAVTPTSMLPFFPEPRAASPEQSLIDLLNFS